MPNLVRPQGFDFTAKPPARVGGGITNETKQTMANIAEVMKAARGATMDDILECTVILSDIKDFDAMNNVYKLSYGAVPPARVAYSAALMGGAAVEIKCSGDVSQYYGRGDPNAAPRQKWLRQAMEMWPFAPK